MNAKLALALILTLQVSISFCEPEELPQELVEKYEMIKEKLLKRAQGLVARGMDFFAAYDQEQVVRGQLDANTPRLVAIQKVADAIRRELDPIIIDFKRSGLAFYNANLRQALRQPLEQAIERIGAFLDRYAPTE